MVNVVAIDKEVKHCILFDSNFNIALMDKNDRLHSQAVFLFQKIWQFRAKVQIIIPPLSIYELIVTLKRKGMSQKLIEEKIIKLVNIEEIMVFSISEISAFKHCKSLLNSNSKKESLRTNDFMIVSIAIDCQSQILTFDESMWRKTRALYPFVYNCKEKSEIDRFLSDFNGYVNPELLF